MFNPLGRLGSFERGSWLVEMVKERRRWRLPVYGDDTTGHLFIERIETIECDGGVIFHQSQKYPYKSYDLHRIR